MERADSCSLHGASNARYLSNLRADTKGNVVITFALTFLLVICFVGGAIDFSMYVLKKKATRDALDEAALSAAIAPSQSEENLKTIADKAFASNVANVGIDATLTSFKYDETSRTVSATATGTYKTFIIGLMGYSTLNYSVQTDTVRASDGTLEVALVLDNTWSMSASLDGTQTKLEVLKTAAQGLVSSIMTPANRDYVKVAVVPYAQYTNVGTANRSATWMSVPADSTVVTTTPASCTTISTSTSCKGGTYGTCTGSRDGVPYTYGCWLVAQTCTTVPITPYQSCTAAKTTTTTKVWYGCVYNQMKSGALLMPDPATAYTGFVQTSSSCLTPIQALTNESATIASALKSLYVSTSSQQTYIPGGLIWGVNVLTPPAPFSEGKAYDPKNKTPRKTIVLMTDGANTAYASSSGSVALASASQLVTTYADQIKVCNYAKSKNIEIYTIGFAVTDATALSNLKSCATDLDHYFDAKSSTDLIAAFKTIGGKLTKVRLTK